MLSVCGGEGYTECSGGCDQWVLRDMRGGVMSSLMALKNLITVSASVTKHLYLPVQIFRNITIFYGGGSSPRPVL